MANQQKPARPEKLTAKSGEPAQIGIYYQRARLYRTVHADGAWAGITPRLELQCTFFSELRPMPEFALNKVTPDGTLGTEIERVEKAGIIREAEINIVMNSENAKSLIDLLERMLVQLNKATGVAEARESRATKSKRKKSK